jgi:ribonuclease I
MTHHDDFLAGRTIEEKEFFAVHGYWPNETGDADPDRRRKAEAAD